MSNSSPVRSPNARNPLKVSRRESPASTRMRVVLLATSAQLARLPLASNETETAISWQLTLNRCGSGAIFEPGRTKRISGVRDHAKHHSTKLGREVPNQTAVQAGAAEKTTQIPR